MTSERNDRGIALILVLIFTVLLYVLVAELVVTARTQRLTGESEALIARMRNHMGYTLAQVEEQLRDDLAAAAAGAAGAGGGDGGIAGLAAATGAAGAGGGEDEGACDSSRDGWFEPSAHADDDLTTYVWVEDENRKFNILALVSPEQEFAEESKHRFARLIDVLREDSEDDLTPADGERIANLIIEWIEGRTRTEYLPRPKLKSDDEERSEVTLPLQLDELQLLPGIGPELFFDKVIDNRVIPGLESALTVHTSLRFDPGDPNNPNNPGNPVGGAAAGGTPAITPAGTPPSTSSSPLPSGGSGASKEPEQPVGIGIKINVNTAPRAVLRCLFPEHEVSEQVIDAILRYRNEEAPEEEGEAEGQQPDNTSLLSNVDLGTSVKKQIFAKLEDLEKVPEFANIPNPEVKQRFLQLTTVKSEVFSVHMASLYKRDEQHGVFVLRRTHSVLVRLEDSGDAPMHPLVLMEERNGVRVMQPDLLTAEWDRSVQLNEMDEFAREERKWNPFFSDFYRPPDKR